MLCQLDLNDIKKNANYFLSVIQDIMAENQVSETVATKAVEIAVCHDYLQRIAINTKKDTTCR